jgi:hypothetical protein
MDKKGVNKFAILVLLVVIIVSGIFLVNKLEVFSEKQDKSVSVTPTTSTSNDNTPRPPSRCSLVAKNDSYVKPDFVRLEKVMAEQPLVKDVPSKGKISLRFFHFTEGCRLWDKSYIISDGKITATNSDADIYITLSSDYVDKITATNFCDIIKEAREKDDLGQWTAEGLSEATLLWRYKGMLKYADCLGIKLKK